MNLSRTLSLLLLAVAAWSAESGAALTGVVKDPQGQPIPSATVTLVSTGGGAGSSTTTDAAGVYRFSGLPGGSYLLRAEAPGFDPFVATDIRLAEGAQTRDVPLAIAGAHEEVVVTASGTPQSFDQVSKAITVIDQSDADARDANSLTDVVALAPGVRVQQLGGPGAFSTIQIRGLRDEDTAVLVDGLRLRDASATQADASGLIEDLLATDDSRVEVLRGSGSSLYGTNAIGGVVNIITDEGGGRTRGSLLVEGGSLGTFRSRAQLAGGFHRDRIEYSLGVTQIDVVNGVGGDSPYRDASVQGRITFHLTPTLRLTARLFGADSFSKVIGEPDVLGSPSGFGVVNAVALPQPLLRLYEAGTPLSALNTGNATFIPAPDNPDSTRDARFVTGALILNGQPAPSVDYSVSYQVEANGRRYGDGPAGAGYQPDSSTRSLFDGRIQTVDAQLHIHLGHANLLTGGYEFESENYANDNSQLGVPADDSAINVTQKSHSVFVQDQAHFLNGRLQFSLAARAQFFTLDTPQFYPLSTAPYQGVAFPAPTPAYTGDGSAAYSLAKSGTKFRAHVGRGYRAPSLYERFGVSFDPVYGYSVYGDPRLKPEHSIGLDAGFDQPLWSGRVALSGSYFYTWLQNVINFDTTGLIDPATDPYGRYIGYLNTRGGISRGAEFSASVHATRALQITAAYTYVNAIERTPIVGDVLQTFVVPRNQFSLQVVERVTRRLSVMLDTLASSSYLAPVYGSVLTQTFRFDGIHKVNLGASYRIPLAEYQALRLFVRADNIGNQIYFESGFPTPGRTAYGGVQFEF